MSPRQNYFFDRIKVLLNNNSNNLCSYSKKKHKIISFFCLCSNQTNNINIQCNNNDDEIKTYKIKRKNKHYPPLYSLFKSPSNIIFLRV